MSVTTLLLNRSDYLNDIEDIKSDWIDSILLELDLDLDFIKNGPIDLVQEYFFENDLDIINYPDINGIRIDKDGDTIAEWAGPEFTLKRDEDGLLYYEVDIESWSIFDKE
jgi:hypothetical protein